MKSTNKVLILGATGGIGGEIARKLIRDEWDVRALRRSTPQNSDRNNSISWISGDALNAGVGINSNRWPVSTCAGIGILMGQQ